MARPWPSSPTARGHFRARLADIASKTDASWAEFRGLRARLEFLKMRCERSAGAAAAAVSVCVVGIVAQLLAIEWVLGELRAPPSDLTCK